jgi:hypothetical protein
VLALLKGPTILKQKRNKKTNCSWRLINHNQENVKSDFLLDINPLHIDKKSTRGYEKFLGVKVLKLPGKLNGK